jgi:hypothetical protein
MNGAEDGWMDGWTDGWMDGWVERWRDGMDGWVDGQTDMAPNNCLLYFVKNAENASIGWAELPTHEFCEML